MDHGQHHITYALQYITNLLQFVLMGTHVKLYIKHTIYNCTIVQHMIQDIRVLLHGNTVTMQLSCAQQF